MWDRRFVSPGVWAPRQEGDGPIEFSVVERRRGNHGVGRSVSRCTVTRLCDTDKCADRGDLLLMGFYFYPEWVRVQGSWVDRIPRLLGVIYVVQTNLNFLIWFSGLTPSPRFLPFVLFLLFPVWLFNLSNDWRGIRHYRWLSSSPTSRGRREWDSCLDLFRWFPKRILASLCT